MEVLISEKQCTPERRSMSRDHGKCFPCLVSELVLARSKTGPSNLASSTRHRHVQVSWVVLCVATAAILTIGIHQTDAANTPAQQASSNRPSSFYRADISSETAFPKASSSSSSSLPSSPSDSTAADLREQSSRSSPSSPSSPLSLPQPDALARLSKVFGISRIPHRTIHRSPPQYMQELYASTTDTGGLTRARGPYNSNTIRSFPDK
ncbi:hypothetical protein EGW08_014519, partial [Elysia chlorotica]